ncbi:hypothetical protein LTR62_008494 [Meristemomyces frigidus]|uniref:Zn(2)-C6 fungal-type domain-containing protein n=1 Tax=Meristemomyces frigidus TaxID=1508187 RepID=A0AAN7TMP6_9PEZI|nr:hypothetical protein LTR62_008494 [Meristemomyces frigidus]
MPQHQYGRRLDLPVLESSPVSRLNNQSQAVSPYTCYPESRDTTATGPEASGQASATSYQRNSAHSPYAGPADEVQYRNSTTTFESSSEGPAGPASSEPQRKYLGVKEVTGEGAFHVYEGGYRIPTQVDGETVNPAWGLTKANKPRKRLALACLDCREKKIKCEPGASSCLQCEKAKRTCRRIPIQTGASESTPTPSSWHSVVSSPVCKEASESSPQGIRDVETEPMSKRRSRDDPSPPEVPSKKQRSASPVTHTHAEPINRNGTLGNNNFLPTQKMAQLPVLDLTWEEDPYNIDSDLTMHIIELYFAHIDAAAYTIYPRTHFMNWVATEKNKCQLERMALYAVLAVGSIFADDRYSGFGKRCGEIAKDAATEKMGSFTLANIHTRIMLSLYYGARGSDGIAWDYAGSAIRACLSGTLRYQTDEACLCKPDDGHYPSRKEFGFNSSQLTECRRRTFWSCFLLDRAAYGATCTINTADVFVRLPCADDEYERGLESHAPHFNNGIIDPSRAQLQPMSPVSPMAWLCLVSSIWGDVLSFTNRTVHRPPQAFAEAYETFYAETYNRLHSWSSCLPSWLRYSDENMARSVKGGYGPIFVSAHALYHFTCMRLNRCVKFKCLDQERLKRNIRAARVHAHTLLSMLYSVRVLKRPPPDAGYDPVIAVLSAPFLGNTILSAIDIISAGGFDAYIGRTLEAVGGGVDCLREASRYWNTARNQFTSSQKRLYSMQNIMTRPAKTQAGAWLGRKWGMKDPLEKDFVDNREQDCIYGLDDGNRIISNAPLESDTYFDALKDEEYHMQTRSPGGRRVT